MTCAEIQVVLSAQLDGEPIPVREERAVEEHLASCLDCVAERQVLEQVARQVRSLPRVTPPAHFGAGVMAQVLEEPAPTPAATPSCPEAAELSALLDGALDPPPAAALREHLEACAVCQAEHAALSALVAAVRSLPRVAPPVDFTAGVLARIRRAEQEDEEQARRARASRAALWLQLGRLAQAAGLLFVLGAGVALTAPGQHRLAYVPDRPSRPFGDATPGPAAFREAPAAPADTRRVEELAPPPYDATWEVDVSGAVEDPASLARSLVAAHAQRVLAISGGPDAVGVVALVPANQVDDLLQRLDAERHLEPRPGAWAAMEQAHAEQDRVLLRNGFVLVGELIDRARALRVGPVVHRLDPADVERVEQAEAPRKVRLLFRKRG